MTSGGNATRAGSSSGAWYSVSVVSGSDAGVGRGRTPSKSASGQGLGELAGAIGPEVQVDDRVAVPIGAARRRGPWAG